MNVKYSHTSSAFSQDSTVFETMPTRDASGHTLEDYRRAGAKKRRQKGQLERLIKFDKAQPTCDCKGGRRFHVVPLKLGTKDVCSLCRHYVRWAREIFLF